MVAAPKHRVARRTMSDAADDAAVLQARIAAFVRAFGLHQPDRTPCGQPVPVSEARAVAELSARGRLTQHELTCRLRLQNGQPAGHPAAGAWLAAPTQAAR